MKKTIYVLALISVCIASLWAPVRPGLTVCLLLLKMRVDSGHIIVEFSYAS